MWVEEEFNHFTQISHNEVKLGFPRDFKKNLSRSKLEILVRVHCTIHQSTIVSRIYLYYLAAYSKAATAITSNSVQSS